ncbi:MAG TPA: radical SAM protein [Desulfomicrobium sp.]|nr:radical SAM protein [Desulfomicrobium sp.]
MSHFGAIRRLVRGRLPGQAVIQVTTRCNARCVQCGMSADNAFARHSLDPDVVDRILDTVSRLGMRAVSFTGGEPLLDFPRLTRMIRRAKRLGIPYIRTGTNGFIFQRHEAPDFRDRMARMADELLESGIRNFWVSLDSCDPAVHEANRGLPGVVRGMGKALPVFHERGLYPSVNLGINRLCGGRIGALQGKFEPDAFREGFAEAFARFFSFALDLGFTIANCCYPMSEEGNAVYRATSSDPFITFTSHEKKAMLQALRSVVPDFRPRIRLFTPLSALDALIRQIDGGAERTYPCRGGTDFFFVDATRGHAYPCGYRSGDDMGPFWEMRDLPENGSACRRCDWECFRDPSELFGPFGAALRNPFAVLRNFAATPGAFGTWLTDLRYYLACDTFDGTRPMRPERLARFAGPASEPELAASFR